VGERGHTSAIRRHRGRSAWRVDSGTLSCAGHDPGSGSGGVILSRGVKRCFLRGKLCSGRHPSDWPKLGEDFRICVPFSGPRHHHRRWSPVLLQTPASKRRGRFLPRPADSRRGLRGLSRARSRGGISARAPRGWRRRSRAPSSGELPTAASGQSAALPQPGRKRMLQRTQPLAHQGAKASRSKAPGPARRTVTGQGIGRFGPHVRVLLLKKMGKEKRGAPGGK